MAAITRALTFAAGAALVAPLAAQAEPLTVTLRGAYDSEYTFRGATLAEDAITTAGEIALLLDHTEVYGGAAWIAPTDQPGGAFDFSDEVQLYGGAAFNPFDGVWLDVSYTQYLYPDDRPGLFQSGQERGEFSVGAFVDVDLLDRTFMPSVFLRYDVEREEFIIEAGADYSHLVGPNLYVDLNAQAGHATSGDGMEFVVDAGALTLAEIADYTFYSAAADLRFDFSGRAEAMAGVRWDGASEDRFIDAFDPVTGLPSEFGDDTVGFRLGVRWDF